ncbi:efflux RND transporter periplasmic adaptor subunit [Colidextribacter sp. OB.20]|uniref:efflux RND transporter periplasmic adaptor subunit n=1 Tax=Colidextribacter sp. OB.20 TaxID=2304568 RepID=UPI0013688523|nr:efflux RND transporter periplasmic adaptor subunit [Colidextribacter sp. OB.20]NBI10097.1 efflux RND transporter periplasmic adaptor subunit [Colidextribacter sp. OB.20]
MEATKIPEQEAPQQARKRRIPGLKLSKKQKKWAKRGIILAAAAAAVFWFTHRAPAGGAGPAGQYAPDTVQRRDLRVKVSGTGTVTPIESYYLKPLVTGEVLEAPFEVGDRVEKGQLLYRLDARDAEMSIQQAELSVRQAQKSYDDMVANLTVRAGGAGVVQQVLVQRGDLVSPGTPIAEIADTSTLTLTVPFHSADARQLHAGQNAQVTLAGTLETLNGTVESVSTADLVGAGGALVRQVKVRVSNPGALTAANAATVQVGDIACAGSANFEEALRQTVVAQASGEVTGVSVTAGSAVSAGSALVSLGGSSAESSLEDMSIALENARLSLQRAQDVLENYTITAPISGTVIEKNIKAGDNVNNIESGALAVIYDLSYLKLEMNISELDLSKLQEGQTVDITADAIPGEVFQGVVDRVSINGTTTNGFTTYPATILLEDYGDLNPGMNVSADIIVEQMENALSIPAAAVQRGDTVLVPLEGCLSPDGTSVIDPTRVEERTVTLGGGDGEYVEITSGLNEGDTVLVPAQVQGGMDAPGGGSVTVS